MSAIILPLMRQTTALRLLRLNREFYERFASEFSAARTRFPPGILRALDWLREARSLVDVGCGSGRIGQALALGAVPNTVVRYRGVDFSDRFLAEARRRGSLDLPEDRDPWDAAWARADLAASGWSGDAALEPDAFEAAVCFSVLFHIPGPRRRLRLLREMARLLAPRGRAAVSVWQLQNFPRLRRKVIPWERAGLVQEAVDPGDFLVDWREGGRGMRYVHQFEEEELKDLVSNAGFRIHDGYRSDGETGNMNLYLLLVRR
jgi:tRNA (uracil-5-)-methyltransferase TRM9